MRYIKYILVAILVGAIFASCSAKTNPENDNNMKGIIIYFSHTGNTASAAKQLAKQLDIKAVRLHAAQEYTSADVDWENEQSRCTQEYKHPEIRPAIKPVDVNFPDYDTVFVGFPIWWYKEPNIIRTFFDTYSKELQGKTIYPFCTSYESSIADADASLKELYPSLDIKKGLRFPASEEEITKWINQ